MNNDHFKKALDKAAEILQFAFDHADQKIDPKKEAEALAQLSALEKSVEEFEVANKKFIEGSHIDEFVMNMMLTDTEAERVTKEQRELLLRAENLKNHAKAAAKNLKQASKKAKNEKLTEKPSEKITKYRKGKFRSMGGTKNWKPL